MANPYVWDPVRNQYWDPIRQQYVPVANPVFQAPQPAQPAQPPPQAYPNPWEQEDRIRDRIRRDQEESDRQKRIAIENYEREKREEEDKRKEAERKAVEKYKQKQKDDEEAEERAWREHERKKKDEKEKEDKAYRERVEGDLGRYGFEKDQVDQMIDPEGRRGSNNALARVTTQKFLRIRRKDVEIETLQAFNVPWGYDPKNSDYYIVYREMSFEESDDMFEHTKRLRKKMTSPRLLEAKPRDVMVRERSKSRDRSRHRSKSPGLREKFAAKVIGID